MPYITVYRSFDSTEISIIRQRFEDEELDYKILDETTKSSAGVKAVADNGVKVQVTEDQMAEARKILKELGFTGVTIGDRSIEPRNPAKNWIAILLAILILIIVSFLIMWFMNPDS